MFYLCDDGWHDDGCHNDRKYDLNHVKVFILAKKKKLVDSEYKTGFIFAIDQFFLLK